MTDTFAAYSTYCPYSHIFMCHQCHTCGFDVPLGVYSSLGGADFSAGDFGAIQNPRHSTLRREKAEQSALLDYGLDG